MIYTGIGSRVTPERVLTRMCSLAETLAARGWTLRSGGAVGADTAFEHGAGPNAEIFYPRGDLRAAKELFEAEVRPLAGCPSIYRMRPLVAALLARNMHQILGADLTTPTAAVLCWTLSDDYRGRLAGGTRYACLLAEVRGIPIFNLASCGLSDDAILARMEALE